MLCIFLNLLAVSDWLLFCRRCDSLLYSISFRFPQRQPFPEAFSFYPIHPGRSHFDDIHISKCRFSNTDRGLRVKTRRGRGKDSVLKGIVFEDLELEGVKAPFVVNSFYFCDPDGRTEYVGTKEALPVDERTPKIESIEFRNIVCRNAHYCGAYIYGLPEQKIERLAFDNVSITYAKEAQTGVAAMMMGCEPASRLGLVIGNVKNLILHNVSIDGQDGERLCLSGVENVEEEQD